MNMYHVGSDTLGRGKKERERERQRTRLDTLIFRWIREVQGTACILPFSVND